MKAVVLFIGLTLPSIAMASEGHGPDWVKFGFHTANLIILLLVIKLAAGKMIKGAVANRAQRIKMHLEESNQMRKEAQHNYDELSARLSHMEKEVEALRTESAASAEREAELIAAQTDADVIRIKDAAGLTIQNETEKAKRALRKEAVDLALKIAEQTLKAQLSDKDQKALAQDFLGSLKEAN
jgi:F-type H+-transporting ATPase subunit b